MKKFKGSCICFLSLIFTLVTFSTPPLTLASEWKWPSTLKVTSQSIGTAGYAVTVGWGSILSKMKGTNVRVTPNESRAEALRWVKQGEVDLIAAPVTDAILCITAEVPEHATKEGGPFQIRIVWQTTTNPFGYFVRGDSDIKTIYDIRPEVKGKRRLGFMAGVPTHKLFTLALVAWLKLDPEKDVQLVPFGSYAACLRSVAEGKADVVYGCTSTPVTYEIEANPFGIRWLDLPADKDLEGRERFLKIRPTTVFAKHTEGVKSAHGVTGCKNPMFYFTRADADLELMYNLTKWFGEHYDAYKDVHQIARDNMVMSSFRESLDFVYIPLHDGLIRYLKEKGIWSEKDNVRQKYNVALVTKYVDAYKAASSEATKRKIEIVSTNQEWLDLWNSYRKGFPIFKAMYDGIPK